LIVIRFICLFYDVPTPSADPNFPSFSSGPKLQIYHSTVSEFRCNARNS